MAIYDLSKPFQRQRFKTYCNSLYKKEKLVELAERKPKRSLSQNSYLHLLLSCFAMETGNTLEEVKRLYYKLLCNPELFVVKRWDVYYNKYIKTLRSSADLTTEEMALSIDRFKQWAAQEAGVYLPDADNPKEITEASLSVQSYEARRYL